MRNSSTPSSLPKIKLLATCDGNKICRDPTTERMTFVDGHQAAFNRHGMCVRAAADPEFDRNCFSTKGESFSTDPAVAARQSDGLRRARQQLSALRFARALDQNGERQLFHRHDLSGRHARDVEAERHPRCAVGRAQRRLWRRRASRPPKAMPQWPTRHCRPRAACSACRRRRRFRPNRCRRRPRRSPRRYRRARRDQACGRSGATPSFFCRLDDEVVYWNTSRLSG